MNPIHCAPRYSSSYAAVLSQSATKFHIPAGAGSLPPAHDHYMPSTRVQPPHAICAVRTLMPGI